MNLRGSNTFIIAIVPFDQIGIDFRYRAEACEFTGSNGALQWTREDLGKNGSGQSLPESEGIAFTALCKRQIGSSRMLTRNGPCSLPVSRQIDYGKNFSPHGWSADRLVRVVSYK